MLRFNTDKKIIACGIDSEHIERFTKLGTGEERPSPLIFSPREIEHYLALDDPAVGFCASFCCKEAFYKALNQPCNFNTCELFWEPPQKHFTITLPDNCLREYKIIEAPVRVELSPERECIVTVFLLQ